MKRPNRSNNAISIDLVPFITLLSKLFLYPSKAFLTTKIEEWNNEISWSIFRIDSFIKMYTAVMLAGSMFQLIGKNSYQ
jgi:hypothetical protein